MDFNTNSCHLSLNKSNFSTKCFFQHTYDHLNEKLVQIFFVKSHELNISIVTKMVLSIHIQYMTIYFIKFCNYLNHFKGIFGLCSIS
jgi:hypothetical protein